MYLAKEVSSSTPAQVPPFVTVLSKVALTTPSKALVPPLKGAPLKGALGVKGGSSAEGSFAVVAADFVYDVRFGLAIPFRKRQNEMDMLQYTKDLCPTFQVVLRMFSLSTGLSKFS
ncbi:hypothetical protein AgCh_016574 [Apium graveolens]